MKINDHTLPGIAWVTSALILVIILILSKGITGDTDSITHYLYARYAFAHPELFLNHWAKPLFTILSSPFAQLGLYGSIFFNLLAGLATTWLIYRISDKLRYDYAWTVIPMVIFSPVYLVNMYTSLTEILFSLVLVGAIYLFLKERYILSAVVISLLPFTRTEGLMFLPLFLVAFAWMRKFKSLPFLVTGLVIFGLLGIPGNNDFWWFFSQIPYSQEGSDLYGSGPFLHYVGRFHRIMGFPLIIMALIGTMALFKWFVSERNLLRDVGWTAEYVLILPSFYGYILIQSLLWWKGLLGVLASDRFMASVLPLGALLALGGFNIILNNLSFNRVIRNRIGALILIAIIITPFFYYKIPFINRGSYDTIEKAANWLKESPYKDRYIYYFDPSVAYFMSLDPWDGTNSLEYYANREFPETYFIEKSIIIWENNFASYEADLSLEKLQNNTHFKQLHVFIPEKEFKSSSSDNYQLVIFERIRSD